MDRNTIIGTLLLGVLFMVWIKFYAPEPKLKTDTEETKKREQPLADKDTNQGDTTTQSVEQAELVADTDETASSDTAPDAALLSRFGNFASLSMADTVRKITVNTNKLKVVLSTQGANIKQVYLNAYKTFESLPLPMLPASQANYMNLNFSHGGNRYRAVRINTADLYYDTQAKEVNELNGNDSLMLSFRATVASGKYIEHMYTFYKDSYHIKYAFRIVGLENVIKNSGYSMLVSLDMPKTEKSADNMRDKSDLYYKYSKNDEVDNVGSSDEQERVSSNLKWVSFKSQFFSTAIIAESYLEKPSLLLMTKRDEDENNIEVCKMDAELSIPMNRAGNSSENAFTLYFGPNTDKTMSVYGVDLEESVAVGWGPLKIVVAGIKIVFNLLEKYMTNYGLIILILAVLIKLIVLPFTYKTYIQQIKMQIVNALPELKALEEKFKDSPTELQTKKMAMYKKFGVSPLGGCLPMLFQMPILISMFQFFPNSLELRQQSFLWATDLSSYDSILDLGFSIPFYGDHVSLFTLLMTVSTLMYTVIQQKMQGSTGPANMKYMMYFMPVIFMGVFNNYSAGLSYYYFLVNVFNLGQTYFIKAFVIDEVKVKAQLLQKFEETKKKGHKKSKLESWMEKQQKKQKDMKRK